MVNCENPDLCLIHNIHINIHILYTSLKGSQTVCGLVKLLGFLSLCRALLMISPYVPWKSLSLGVSPGWEVTAARCSSTHSSCRGGKYVYVQYILYDLYVSG